MIKYVCIHNKKDYILFKEVFFYENCEKDGNNSDYDISNV